MTRPTHALISIAALAHNLHRARALAPASKVWAVVKANGYGHGLHAALEGFQSADGLALLEFEMALQLRQAGWSKPILMLEGPFEPDDVQCARQFGLSLVMHRSEQIDWLAALGPGPRLDIYLKFNSGMNRLGFTAAAFRQAFRRLATLPATGEVTLMTHFANADHPGGIERDWPAFEAACDGFAAPRSTSNSAAVIDHRLAHGAWVRPGVMLYGATPFATRSAASIGLKPAMGLHSRLIAVQTLGPGDAVGYGSRFVADHPLRIGIVACGYADGYPRHAPTGTPVIVAGVRTRTVGRVAMDMIMIDLEPVPAAQVDSPVELWGEQLPIDEVAQAAGTIGYELMCALAPRVRIRIER